MVISQYPYSTVKEPPFTLVYDVNTILQVEIDTPIWRLAWFNEEENEIELRREVDLVEKISEIAHIRKFIAK